jgi:hypothetical protein
MMNRIILNAKNNHKTTRIVSQVNKIRLTNLEKSNDIKNSCNYLIKSSLLQNKMKRQGFQKNSKNSKREFCSFSRFPNPAGPPDSPEGLLFMAIALCCCYYISKY